MRRLLLLLALCLPMLRLAATDDSSPTAEVSQPVRVSLLTCSPGQDAYTRFGHTALRVTMDNGADLVFNYGIFSFHTDHFIFRFVKGETDYELGLQWFDDFVTRYTGEGFTVSEQVLGLSAEERMAVMLMLTKNYLPENRVYRYNFLYDNCTTRALDVIEQALNHPLDFSASTDTAAVTLRDIIHDFTAGDPWLLFGIDMVLGSEVDRPLTGKDWRKRLFIPSLLQANLRCTGLVKSERTYEPAEPMAEETPTPLTPRRVAYVLLVAALIVSYCERRRGWGGRAMGGTTANRASALPSVQRRVAPTVTGLFFDIALHTLQGLAGCIVAFLFCCSEHPAVGTNWLVLCLNPLAFVLVAQDICRFRRQRGLWQIGRVDIVEAVNLAVLVLTYILAWTPLQAIHPAMRIMALTLAIRSATHLRNNKSTSSSLRDDREGRPYNEA